MSAVPRASPYHVLHFDAMVEAAAFVGALSRFLASPKGSRTAQGADVWYRRGADNDTIDIYLSEGAFAATTVGFAAPPTVGTVRGSELPADARQIIPACASLPLGMADAMALLAAP